mmetsp:Transcript_103260/g.291590  ORF Transcript_103260/g.291590 Transcript_103260/m.291590 type:complete len:182 (-) Transcript_103260:146-691(-)
MPVIGTVKTFNPQRGFGFITVDGAAKDYFVHNSDIKKEGFRSLREGEVVQFEPVVEGEKYKAIEVTGPDGAEVKGQPTGIVKSYNPVKGFGFIAVEGEEGDYFVHQSDIKGNVWSLVPGERVFFEPSFDKEKSSKKAMKVVSTKGGGKGMVPFMWHPMLTGFMDWGKGWNKGKGKGGWGWY